MALGRSSRRKLADAQWQIQELQDRVAALAGDYLPAGGSGSLGRVGASFGTAWDNTRRQAASMPKHVQEQPIVSVMIAAALGWVIGRLMP
jgi:hypothetical protein